MNCPNCKANISPENINIQADIAKCDGCHNIFKISQNISEKSQPFSNTIFNIEDDKPNGIWVKREYNQIIIKTSGDGKHNFITIGIFLFFLYMFSNILSSTFDDANIFFILFFVFIFGYFIRYSFGILEIVLDTKGGKIIEGLPSIGWTSTDVFDWNKVLLIREKNYLSSNREHISYYTKIVIEGASKISFGSNLSEKQRFYIVNVLKQSLHNIQTTGTL